MRKKDVLEVIVMGVIAVGLLVTFTGCSSIKTEDEFSPVCSSVTTPDGKTVSTPLLAPDGKTAITAQVKKTKTKNGFVTAQKTVNAGGGKQGLFLEPTGDSSNPLFNIKIFAGVDIYQSCPSFSQGETNPPMYEEFEESSLLDKVWALFGIKMATKGFAYTGVAGESAAETKARLEALRAQYSGDLNKEANALANYALSTLTPEQRAEMIKQLEAFKAANATGAAAK